MLRFIKVSGDSLSPEYQEGDFVLVARIPFFSHSYYPGDVIVFRHSAYGVLIKKVVRVLEDETLFVAGSHDNSLDSRKLGSICQEDVIGKMIWRIARPRARV